MRDIDGMDGLLFEQFVAERLQARGYQTENIGASGDFGVDVVASRAGQRWAVQVKRYKSKVSRTAVSDAVAGKFYWKCEGAWVVTNSYFTKDAKTLAHHTNCRLSDRDDLRNWLYEEEQERQPNVNQPKAQNPKTPQPNANQRRQRWRDMALVSLLIISIMLLTGPSSFSRQLRQGIGQGVARGVARVQAYFQVPVVEAPSEDTSTGDTPAGDTVPPVSAIPFRFDD